MGRISIPIPIYDIQLKRKENYHGWWKMDYLQQSGFEVFLLNRKCDTINHSKSRSKSEEGRYKPLSFEFSVYIYPEHHMQTRALSEMYPRHHLERQGHNFLACAFFWGSSSHVRRIDDVRIPKECDRPVHAISVIGSASHTCDFKVTWDSAWKFQARKFNTTILTLYIISSIHGSSIRIWWQSNLPFEFSCFFYHYINSGNYSSNWRKQTIVIN